MRKLNGSNVTTGFQPILCSLCTRNGLKSYRKKCSNFKVSKLNLSVNIDDLKKIKKCY